MALPCSLALQPALNQQLLTDATHEDSDPIK